MILTCSQCGAKIKIDQFKRFLTCPYCKSSLVVERDRTVECYVLRHGRNDIWVRGVIRGWFKRTGVEEDVEEIRIDFKLFPVWHASFENGQTVTQPAAKTLHTEISSVKIPAGDLKAFDRDTSLIEVMTPDVSHEAAAVWTTDTHDEKREVKRLWLVYLPIYFIDYRENGERHRASVVGESTKIYSDTKAVVDPYKIPVKHLIFFTAAFATFLILGFSISEDILIRGISMAAAALLFSAASWFYLRK
ncbi:MAG: hypothetical protein JW984_08020 [Deltaproteobacteria bacterium]|uniref:Zinc ribbon domain-containing protein n=1 Tax=Candidatus Zymogenus saltonus TaxID=2844893 RepID=A0A9D8KDS5_9DELT|nr:hypothetical protein [Candidatus Zymogenus saltonus]